MQDLIGSIYRQILEKYYPRLGPKWVKNLQYQYWFQGWDDTLGYDHNTLMPIQNVLRFSKTAIQYYNFLQFFFAFLTLEHEDRVES